MALSFAFIALVASSAWADGMDSLEAFVHQVRSGRAEFTQVVTAPPRKGEALKPRQSSGSFEFQRPNRFKFSYRKPFEELIVADGKTLWLYDADLNQVTARSQDQVLGSTPAALIAAAPDLQALRAHFTLQSQPAKDGLEWVLAQPKDKEGQLQSLRVGFKGDQLAALEIVDNFGQQSVLSFSQVQSNVTLPADSFNFKPPAGADLVRQ